MRISLTILGGLPHAPEIVEMDGQTWRMKGECNKCGQCCRKPDTPFPNEDNTACSKLRRNVDENGIETFECSIYWYRPWACAVSPLPWNPMPPECTLEWVKDDLR